MSRRIDQYRKRAGIEKMEHEVAKQKYTIAVDFDGVIHSYTSPWVSPEVIPDPPVEGAPAWLIEMHRDFDVVIHTTRGKTAAGRNAVLHWLDQHGVNPEIISEVTTEKPAALIYVDDRAWRFEGPGTFPTARQIMEARPWNK